MFLQQWIRINNDTGLVVEKGGKAEQDGIVEREGTTVILLDEPLELDFRLQKAYWSEEFGLQIQDSDFFFNANHKRQLAYPAIGDQLDMLWAAMKTGDTPLVKSFFAALKAAKDAVSIPKTFTVDGVFNEALCREEINTLINAIRCLKLIAPVTFESNSYDADEVAQKNIQSTLSMVAAGMVLPENFAWRTETNQLIPMTHEKLRSLGQAMFTRNYQAYQESWTRKSDLDSISGQSNLMTAYNQRLSEWSSLLS